MKLQLIRNATLRIQYGGHCFVTDPYLADKFSRPTYAGKSKNPTVDLPIPVNEILQDMEMVLLSHIHSDHFDPAAKEALPKDTPILCQSEDVQEIRKSGFVNVTPIENEYVWKDIRITRVRGRHGSGKVLEDMGIASGYILEADGEPMVYWVGDSILCDETKAAMVDRHPDVVLTHSGGAVWGEGVKIMMDEVQTVAVCKQLPNSKIVAIHMEAVDHATVSREYLRQYARDHGVLDEHLIIPSDGAVVDF